MNIRKTFLIAVPALAALLAAYTVYDNKRIVVKEQIVYIENLPQEFDGFRILQLSDLHGRVFGNNQSGLIDKVNGIGYDVIAFTGDMEETSDKDLSAFIELLKGIENKEHMFYVNGNDDLAYSSITGNVYEVGDKLIENGCILLTEPYPIKRADKTLWISNYFNKSSFGDYTSDSKIFRGNQEEYAAYKDYTADLKRIFTEIKGNADIKIAITHMPLTAGDFADTNSEDILDYSLILAGHYHGGQLRIPFYGALFTPGSRNEDAILFPKQNEVMGLSEYNGIKQYISAGLGASVIPVRVFDTPEINLIILKAK